MPDHKSVPSHCQLGPAVQKSRKSQSLPIKPSSAAEAAYNNLVTALGSFLHATRPAEARSINGAPSLMSACLRKVPAYVELEKPCAVEDEDDSDGEPDIASEIYNELEAYGSAPDGGWSGLQEVVRADGLHRIKAAISDGLLPVRTVEALVTACCRADNVGAGMQLISTALEVDLPGRDLILSKLLMLGEQHTGGAEYCILRTVSDLLRRNVISLQELCIQKTIWQIFFRSITSVQTRPEAVGFLSTCILVAWKRITMGSAVEPSDEVRTVLDSIRDAAVLLVATSAVGGRSGADTTSVHATLPDAVRRMTACMVITCVDATRIMRALSSRSVAASHTQTLLSSFLVGSLVLGDTGSTPTSNLRCLSVGTLLTHLATLEGLHDDKSASPASQPCLSQQDTFISDVALTIGRWDVEAGDAFLTKTTGKLLQAVDRFPDAAAVVKQLALGSARAYADARLDKNNLMFAEEVEDMVLHGARLSILQTPGATARSKRDSYRWEDGLCEWIAKTPFSIGVDEQPAKGLEPMVKSVKPELEDHNTSLPTVPKARRLSKDRAQAPQFQAKRPLSDLEDNAQAEYSAAKHNKKIRRRAHPEHVVPINNKRADSARRSCDELDELAFSAQKAKQLPPSKVLEPIRNVKVPIAKARHLGSLKRSSSESASWATLDTSDDELG
ncbi:hypothetical protein LTR36_007413 [Oleoguttula mirabilis]|uniref:Uncharacterized protein n=1 Tax=Oleoguttula mirabilis TaxID=1507867 RepID=A0AAV9J9C3_9PEZI|nr:hypothetical protein LTR36_007413 [Oleoguttula mirabilis]